MRFEDEIAINARLIKETAMLNEQVKTAYYEQDELRRKNEYTNNRNKDHFMSIDNRNKRNRDFEM